MSVHFVVRPSAAQVSTSVVVPPSVTVPGMVGGFLAAPQPSSFAQDPHFLALQGQVTQMAEALNILVGGDAAPVSPAGIVSEVAVSGGTEVSTYMFQGSIHGNELEDLTEILERSLGDESEGGNECHGSDNGVGGPDRWYFPKKHWRPFWDADGNVAGFMVGNSVVPGSMEFSVSNAGIRWCYSQAKPLMPIDDSTSDRAKVFKAFKTTSNLWLDYLDEVRVQIQNFGVASLKEKWVKVSLDEDSFLLNERFWDAKGLWKDFLDGRKLKWPSLDRFINLSFANPELRHLHLCLHAPKLDLKGALVQLLRACSLTNLSADFMAR